MTTRAFTIPAHQIKTGDLIFEDLRGAEVRKVAAVERGTWPGEATPAVIVAYDEPRDVTRAYLLDQEVHVIRREKNR